MKAKVITLYNNKGGVGKTTSAINVAYVLSVIRKKKVLVVDCDGQGNASRFFTDTDAAIGIENAFTDKQATANAAKSVTRYPNIDVICSTPNMNNAAVEFSALSLDEKQFNVSKFVTENEADYDYIIVDLPPTLNELVAMIITVCDNVFVPLELGSFSVQGIASVTDVISAAGVKFGGCFVTRFDRKNKADVQMYDMLRDTLGNKLMFRTIPYSNVIKNSISCSMTANEYMGWTEAAAAYVIIANDIIERCGESE